MSRTPDPMKQGTTCSKQDDNTGSFYKAGGQRLLVPGDSQDGVVRDHLEGVAQGFIRALAPFVGGSGG